MNKIYLKSGENSPSNDVIKLSVAMESDSESTIYLQASGGKSLISYSTKSDYVFGLERYGRFSGQRRELQPAYSNNIGYESGICWAPGIRIAANSESTAISESSRVPLLTPKSIFADDEIEKNNTIVLDDYYGSGWLDMGCGIEVSNIKIASDSDGRIKGQEPFIDVIEPQISNTGEIKIYSSDLNSTVFSFEIKKDLQFNTNSKNYSDPPRRKLSRINYGNKSLEGFVEEWNSIFNITKKSNINSSFRDGSNIDSAFVSELKAYFNEEWDGKIEKYLWFRAVNDPKVELSTNDPTLLKTIIFQQLKNYGASDDVKIISEAYGMDLDWHMGTGGVDARTKSKRYLSKGTAYIPALKVFKSIYKIGGFAPRGAYFANNEANIAMTEHMK